MLVSVLHLLTYLDT